jgi:hypothetical protein
MDKTLLDLLALVSSLIAIISVCTNIIQYYRRKSLMKEFEAYVSASYDAEHMIARSCARMRERYAKKRPADELIHHFWCEIHNITGVTDAARSNAVRVAKTHLRFTPLYLHPAEPDQVPDKKTLYGEPPETRYLENVDEYLKPQISKTETTGNSLSPTEPMD